MLIEIARRWRGAYVTTIYLDGVATLGESADFFAETLNRELGEAYVVIDWTKLDYIRSTGLGELVGTCTAVARRSPGRCFFSNPSERVLKLIKLAGADDSFRIFVDEDEAMAYVALHNPIVLDDWSGNIKPTPDMRRVRVFLCHAKEDKPRVRQIAEHLERQGIDVWFDENNLLPGDDWRLEIQRALRGADAVIAFLSSSSTTKRGYVQKELKVALDIADEQPEGSIFVIPALLEECRVPDRLSCWQWVDLAADDGLTRLVSALSKLTTRL